MERLGRMCDEGSEQNEWEPGLPGGHINVIKNPVEDKLWEKMS